MVYFCNMNALSAQARRTDHLAELAKIAGNGNFPFPNPVILNPVSSVILDPY